jgi:hypothetical protein
MLMPRVRLVSSQIRSLNRRIAFGAMRLRGCSPPVFSGQVVKRTLTFELSSMLGTQKQKNSQMAAL